MKNYSIVIFTLLLSFIYINTFSQVETLNRIGQTRRSAAYHVNWDNENQRLIVGAGAVLKIYDASDINDIQLIAQRPLLGTINETAVFEDVLFVAATHQGVFALDYNSDTLSILAHYDMQDQGSKAAYDMWQSNDTLFVADNLRVSMLEFTGSDFNELEYFGPWVNSFAVARRGDLVAVANRGFFNGAVNVYDIHDLNTSIASWQSDHITVVMDIQFADLNDSIIYVCGGPDDLLSTRTYFFALELDGSNLSSVDTFLIDDGIPLIAQVNILNMDSRNDTLYLATSAAWGLTMGAPLTYMPIIDASGLPDTPMEMLGYINAGLWHFDAALIDDSPYMAIASEWAGVLISDVSEMAAWDTLCTIPTGGWCVNSKLVGDTLWACHEGAGLYAYALDSLLFTESFMSESELLHINTGIAQDGFVSDFDFINDTLIVISNGDFYNLKPWMLGGEPQKIREVVRSWVSIHIIDTNLGKRIIGGFDNLAGTQSIQLFDPNEYPLFNLLTEDTISFNNIFTTNSVNSLAFSGDTIYFGKQIDSIYHMIACKVINDQFISIDSVIMPGEILSISIDGNQIAASCQDSVLWFSWNESSITEDGSFYHIFLNAQDVYLKNEYIYIADKFYGLKVLDISQAELSEESAACIGSEAWVNVFGSKAVDIGDNGMIFLSDFQAGVIIIEAYDQSLTANADPLNIIPRIKLANIYPNPAVSTFTVELQNDESNWTFCLYNSVGQLVKQHNNITDTYLNVGIDDFAKGIYFYKIETSNNLVQSGKIVIK